MPYIPPEVVAKAKEILTGAAAMWQSSRICRDVSQGEAVWKRPLKWELTRQALEGAVGAAGRAVLNGAGKVACYP